ncbi:MAG: tyrosine-type recombinase/integrase [Chloroflexota bacterium]
MQAFLLDRQASRCTPKTIEHYTYTVGSFINYLRQHNVNDITEIKPTHIRSFLVSLQDRGLKDTSQHAHARGIKAWLNWLVQEDELEYSPMNKVRMPKLAKRIPPPFRPDDLRKLLGACDRKTARGARNYAIMLCLLDSGMRAEEFVALNIGDIDMRNGMTLSVGKGGKMRQVRMGSRARAAILKMLRFRPGALPEEPLFVGYNGLTNEITGRMTKSGLQTTLVRIGRSVGVTPCMPHRFRRTFAIWCLRSGMDLERLRILMGHETLAVLKQYLAIAGEDVETAHREHSPADNLQL